MNGKKSKQIRKIALNLAGAKGLEYEKTLNITKKVYKTKQYKKFLKKGII